MWSPGPNCVHIPCWPLAARSHTWIWCNDANLFRTNQDRTQTRHITFSITIPPQEVRRLLVRSQALSDLQDTFRHYQTGALRPVWGEKWCSHFNKRHPEGLDTPFQFKISSHCQLKTRMISHSDSEILGFHLQKSHSCNYRIKFAGKSL